MSNWPFDKLTPFKYGLILADPPWKTEMYSDAGLSKSPEIHYPTMSLSELKKLPVGHLAARDCILVMWTRWINLEHALELADHWGFTYKSGGSWQKRSPTGKKTFGGGYIFRNCTEPYLGEHQVQIVTHFLRLARMFTPDSVNIRGEIGRDAIANRA